MIIISIVCSIIAGITIVVSRIINANLAKHIGVLEGTFFNFLTGIITSIIVFLISRETFGLTLNNINKVTIWIYFGGLLGVFIVLLSNYIVHKISAFYMTLFMFVGQLGFGILIDFFMDGKISFSKIVGGSLVLSGLIYNMLIDYKKLA